MDKGDRKPPSPFQFNPHWLPYEDLCGLIAKEWVHFDPDSDDSATKQFQENLMKVKKLTRKWANNKFKNSQ